MDCRSGRRARSPRPETELLAEATLAWLKELPPPERRLLDFGTGTGCLAIALTVQCDDSVACALDISPVRPWNSPAGTRHDTASSTGSGSAAGDGFAACRQPERFSVIVSNPPYIAHRRARRTCSPKCGTTTRAAPWTAGMTVWISTGVSRRRRARGSVGTDGLFLEFGDGQIEPVRALFESHSWIVEAVTDDYSGRPRVLSVEGRRGLSPGWARRTVHAIRWQRHMDALLIRGGVPLRGEVTVSGAKNAVLPIMAATLLTSEPCIIRRVPDLSDVRFMGKILESLGAQVKFEGSTVTVQAGRLRGVVDYDLIRKMRGSICILGPLLGRLRRARVSLPGGCVIGTRPIDLHLKGLRGWARACRLKPAMCGPRSAG